MFGAIGRKAGSTWISDQEGLRDYSNTKLMIDVTKLYDEKREVTGIDLEKTTVHFSWQISPKENLKISERARAHAQSHSARTAGKG